MYFVVVKYARDNSTKAFPCISYSVAVTMVEQLGGKKVSENYYTRTYSEDRVVRKDEIFISVCDVDIEKIISIQQKTQDRRNLEIRKTKIRGMYYGS